MMAIVLLVRMGLCRHVLCRWHTEGAMLRQADTCILAHANMQHAMAHVNDSLEASHGSGQCRTRSVHSQYKLYTMFASAPLLQHCCQW